MAAGAQAGFLKEGFELNYETAVTVAMSVCVCQSICKLYNLAHYGRALIYYERGTRIDAQILKKKKKKSHEL